MLSYETQQKLVEQFILKWLQMGFGGAKTEADLSRRGRFLILMLEVVMGCDRRIAYWHAPDGGAFEESPGPVLESILNILQEQRESQHQLRMQCAFAMRFLSANAPQRLVKVGNEIKKHSHLEHRSSLKFNKHHFQCDQKLIY